MSKAAKKEETQVAVQETQLPATANLNTQIAEVHAQAQAQAQKMKDAGIEIKDLEIPKLMLMQSTSDAVGEGLAKFGQIINTMDNSVLGGIDEGPVEIIPLKQFKTVRIYDVTEQPPKFLRVEPDDGKNSSFENREGLEGDMPVKRVLNMNFFVLLKKEVDEDEAFPAVLSFKSTGIPAGKQLATHIFKMIQLDRKPYSKSVQLTVKKDKKDKNTYAVFGIDKGQVLEPKVVALAEKWLVSLAAANVTITGGDDDLENDDAASAAAPTVVSSSPSEAGPY